MINERDLLAYSISPESSLANEPHTSADPGVRTAVGHLSLMNAGQAGGWTNAFVWHFITSVSEIPAEKRVGTAVVDVDGFTNWNFLAIGLKIIGLTQK